MATPAERKEEKRRLALEDLERQKAEGSLVTRKMTAEERKKYPARPPREPRKSARRPVSTSRPLGRLAAAWRRSYPSAASPSGCPNSGSWSSGSSTACERSSS